MRLVSAFLLLKLALELRDLRAGQIKLGLQGMRQLNILVGVR